MAGEEEVGLVLDECREAMQKPEDNYKHALIKVRTGRASTSLLYGIMINYYDTPTPLKQLAGLSVPDPRLSVVSPLMPDGSAYDSTGKWNRMLSLFGPGLKHGHKFDETMFPKLWPVDV